MFNHNLVNFYTFYQHISILELLWPYSKVLTVKCQQHYWHFWWEFAATFPPNGSMIWKAFHPKTSLSSIKQTSFCCFNGMDSRPSLTQKRGELIMWTYDQPDVDAHLNTDDLHSKWKLVSLRNWIGLRYAVFFKCMRSGWGILHLVIMCILAIKTNGIMFSIQLDLVDKFDTDVLHLANIGAFVCNWTLFRE